MAGILDRLVLVILPLVTLFPLVGVTLSLLDRRHRRRIARRYERLRESAIRGESSPSLAAVEAEIESLHKLRREVVEETNVPPMYFGEVFHLTMHIDLVLERLETRRQALIETEATTHRALNVAAGR
jgi:hypothetical protein